MTKISKRRIQLILAMAITLLVSLFFMGEVMARGALVNEVLALGRPDKFKSTDVTDIVKKYVPVGSEKKIAIRTLKEQGFKVEEKLDKKYKQCFECEDVVVLAGYTKKNTIPFFPDESFISIKLEFNKNQVAFIVGHYIGNPY